MPEDIRTTRPTLIQRIKDSSDDAAWGEFCQIYWDAIIGWARMMGCQQHLANDIFQETMVCLLKQMPSFQYDPSRGSFRAFLKTIVSRRVMDEFRRQKPYVSESSTENQETGETLLDRTPDTSAKVDEEMDRFWLRSALSQALKRTYKKIDPLTYKAVCMYLIDGMPVGDVCKKLGIAREGTLYQQKSRFLLMLKREFSALLEEHSDSEFSDMLNRDNDFFLSAIKDVIENMPDCRETIIQNKAPAELADRIRFARDILMGHPAPNSSGAFIFNCDTPKEWINLDKTFTIGREKTCELMLDSEEISGIHASIKKESDTYCLVDENSRNGVYLNGQKIKDKVMLHDGDIIQIGKKHTMMFSLK